VDKFDEMFSIQKDFTEKFFKSKKLSLEYIANNKEELVKWNKEYILALIAEATEVLNEVDWKMHKNMEMPVDARDRLLEESIDVMKFLLGLMIVNGFSREEIYSKFISKSLDVIKKFDKEQHGDLQKKLYGG
jgi:dimeric dUTPase (all-alpha-NTP-PPase superfamily)